jgi:magnesium-transporting ATPase (P-type)
MVSSVTLALAISFEPHERDVMSRPPRVANQPLLNRFGIWRIAFISVLLLVFTFGTFYWLTHHGASVELARTAAVNAMVLGQVFYLVNSRFLLESCLSIRALMGNPLIPAAIGGVIVLQALFTYAPFMHHIFGSESVPLWIWKWLLLGGVDVANFFMVLKEGAKQPGPYNALADAKAAGAVTLNYGLLVNAVISFLLVAFAVFLLIKGLNATRRLAEAPAAAPPTKECQYCTTAIPIKATRCPQCTSQLAA